MRDKENNFMTNLNKLTAIIAEAVPEIMELKEGCKFTYNKRNYTFIADTGMMTDLHQGCYGIFLAKPDRNIEREDIIRINTNYDFKILGSPITIATVLMAFDRGAEKWKNGMKIDLPSIGVNSYGGVFIDGSYGVNDETYYEMIGHWNLAQDDLSLQSEETIIKLLEILQ